MNYSNERLPKISETVPQFNNAKKGRSIIESCKNTGTKFTDPEFKPTLKSLYGEPPEPESNQNWKKYEWSRASDIMGSAMGVFHDIKPEDIIQGGLGDCYFLSSISALAERPALIRRLFDIEEVNPQCVYNVWLNINGAWTDYILDDYFPIINSGGKSCEFAFSRTNQDEIWAMLLEKAYAKAYGNFQRIVGGDPVYALRDLTGAPYLRLTDELQADPSGSWSKIWNANKKGHVITCYTKSAQTVEEKSSTGIVSGHAYSLIDCQEVVDSRGRQARIVQIRNPWGKFEWTGDWSDSSPLWTEATRQQCRVVKKDDGIFWMAFEQFIQNYEGVGICEVEGTHFSNSVAIQDKTGEEKQILRFDVDTAGEYTVSVDQKDTRSFREGTYQYSYFRATIGRLVNNDIDYVGASLSPSRNIFVKSHLEPGSYVILVDTYWQSIVKEAVVSLYGPGKAGIRNVAFDATLFRKAEYLIWRNFCLQNERLFKAGNPVPLNDGYRSATLQKSNFQSGDLGMNLNLWKYISGNGAVVKSFKALDVKGFDIITENDNGDSHAMSINPNGVEAEIFKMDPRKEAFSCRQQSTGTEIHDGPIPEDNYVVARLLGTAAPIPPFSGASNAPQPQKAPVPKQQQQATVEPVPQTSRGGFYKPTAPHESLQQEHEHRFDPGCGPQCTLI
jgi:hypothetical protein